MIATSTPGIPASLYPTTIAPFTAIGPGDDWSTGGNHWNNYSTVFDYICDFGLLQCFPQQLFCEPDVGRYAGWRWRGYRICDL